MNQDGTTNQLFHAYLNGEELSTTAGGFQLNYPVVNDENTVFGAPTFPELQERSTVSLRATRRAR